MKYIHHSIQGDQIQLAPGKIVCVGRNYVEHAKELNNPVPNEPILFMKPATSFLEFGESSIVWPAGFGECHLETELALLIKNPLNRASPSDVLSAIWGVGLGLDLTLRDLQTKLKEKGHPWEKSKAFNASNPLSKFVSLADIDDIKALSFTLYRNHQLQQHGIVSDMVFGVVDLVAYISQWFELSPGDVVMTGTPSGVGALQGGDELKLTLKHHEHILLTCETTVQGECLSKERA